jgi:hypothetical protein
VWIGLKCPIEEQITGFCEHGNETSGSVNEENILI